ncbi:MAG: S-layer homology domain-containing protein [Kofleriaceae bacterium]
MELSLMEVYMLSRSLFLACVLSSCATPETSPAPSAGLDPSPGSGLKMGLVTGSIYDDLVANPGARMADFASLGVKALRVEIICGEVCDFGKYRTIVDAAKRYGIEVLAVVQSNAIGFNPNVDLDAYIAKYYTVVDRLLAEIPDLRFIEVENEPDVYDFNPLVDGNLDRYALLVTRVFEHYYLTRTDGRPQIVAFDFSRQDQPAFAAVYNHQTITNHRNGFREIRGLPDGLPADIVSIHGYGEKTMIPDEPNYNYGGQTMDDAVRGFLNREFDAPPVRSDDQRFNRSIINRSPVWYTEVGHEWTQVGGEDRQALALHQSFQTLKRYPQITAAFWYDYRDDEAGGSERAGLRGNRDTGFVQHAAWWAYQQEAGVGSRATFTDVPPDHWAYAWIEALYARGITKGCDGDYASGTLAFCDTRDVSIDEVRVLIARAAGQAPEGPDVSPAASRAELARQLAPAIGAWGSYDGTFEDVGPDHAQVHEIYGLAQRRGDDGEPIARGTIIHDEQGIPHRYFSPGNTLTRAEAAAFLARAYNLH